MSDTLVEARAYLLEQVDDAAVVQLYADGFDALSLQEKVLEVSSRLVVNRAALKVRRPAIDELLERLRQVV